MSDANRLRQAADELESWHEIDEYERATAALLRAVADDEGWFAVNKTWQHPTWTAALSLADVILGGDQ